jgi:hypothetical protein
VRQAGKVACVAASCELDHNPVCHALRAVIQLTTNRSQATYALIAAFLLSTRSGGSNAQAHRFCDCCHDAGPSRSFLSQVRCTRKRCWSVLFSRCRVVPASSHTRADVVIAHGNCSRAPRLTFLGTWLSNRSPGNPTTKRPRVCGADWRGTRICLFRSSRFFRTTRRAIPRSSRPVAMARSDRVEGPLERSAKVESRV